MNKIELLFLDILKASLAGAKAPALRGLSQEEISALIGISSQHKVLPLVFEACHEDLPVPALKNMVRQQVMIQTIKSNEFLQLYGQLLEHGLHPIVVKGIICRNLYPKPDHRISADEDLLIPPSELDAARSILEAFGMYTTVSNPDAYEYPYRKAQSPLYIELHKNLFPPENNAYGDWNTLFDHVFDDSYFETIQGITVYTMKPTDHLLYLICHALKHFMHSGFGIRQVCDIIMYADRWNSVIDWEQLFDKCKSIHATYFAASVFQIGSKYLNFDNTHTLLPACWTSLSLDESDMLEDLLAGGVYGSSSVSRMHSSNMTLNAVSSSRKQGRGKVSIFSSVFPSAAKLEARFPYLKEHPWMLPAAWCQRLVQYGRETAAGGSDQALEAVKIGAKRVELLRQYGVIK